METLNKNNMNNENIVTNEHITEIPVNDFKVWLYLIHKI